MSSAAPPGSSPAPRIEQAFDWLFVDEAGQVGLANMVAMGRAARNIVLVGDPRQLPQVIQGAHPEPANLSCLDWMLGDHATVPPDRGIFLPVSRRMHPDVCRFISDQVYEGRLTSHPDTARQARDRHAASPRPGRSGCRSRTKATPRSLPKRSPPSGRRVATC